MEYETDGKCDMCKYWEHCREQYGECRRHAPVVLLPGNMEFPVTTRMDWCGDYEKCCHWEDE